MHQTNIVQSSWINHEYYKHLFQSVNGESIFKYRRSYKKDIFIFVFQSRCELSKGLIFFVLGHLPNIAALAPVALCQIKLDILSVRRYTSYAAGFFFVESGIGY